MLRELDCVRLAVDLPGPGLNRGDLGTIVHVYDSGAGFEVEFLSLSGETLAVVTLGPEQIRAVGPDDSWIAGGPKNGVVGQHPDFAGSE